MQLFFSVGEPSGDQHAAHLIQELQRRRPDCQFVGYGGSQMERVGFEKRFELTSLAVMGFLPVVPLLWKFYTLVRQANRYFRESKPDAVVLVDFPGFNWWIARKAKAAGIPVFYYLTPQLWAWGPWRIERVRKFVDHMLCALPFEKQWYADRGVEADYVGHPFFDEVAAYQLDAKFLEAWSVDRNSTVAILPGSRNQEVHRNWPVMLDVIRKLHVQLPQTRFLIACFNESHQRFCQGQLLTLGRQLPVHCFVGKTSEIIELADCCLAVSGSVSLELLARKTPTVIVYHNSHMYFQLGKLMMNCRYITLPNLFADREVMPEFHFAGNRAPYVGRIANVLSEWLTNHDERHRVATELAGLRDSVVQPNAVGVAADTILSRLSVSTPAKRAA